MKNDSGQRKAFHELDLDDLLAEDPIKPKNSKPKNLTTLLPKSSPVTAAKKGLGDDNFYSSLAAKANSDDGSELSEADVNKLAHSLGDLDDLDADLFGGSLRKKNKGRSTTPRQDAKSPMKSQSPKRDITPGDLPTSPPGSARTNPKRKPVKPASNESSPSPIGLDPAKSHPEQKPSTAPGKASDISSASQDLKPGMKVQPRPETAPRIKKKFDFGDFDPDDPLAGIFSGSDELSESDRPKSGTKQAVAGNTKNAGINNTEPTNTPQRSNLLDRPPTRSGSSPNTETDIRAVDTGSGSTPPGTKNQTTIFSDSDDLLDGLGLEEKAKTDRPQQEVSRKTTAGNSQEVLPARSALDNLLGKGSGAVTQLLERKGTKELVLERKYSGSTASVAGPAGGQQEEEVFQFGSYQPSAASGSRPSSRRSVRFQDDDDIFGLESHKSPRALPPTSRKPPPGMEWLETAAVSPRELTESSGQQLGGPVPSTPAQPSLSASKTPMVSSDTAASLEQMVNKTALIPSDKTANLEKTDAIVPSDKAASLEKRTDQIVTATTVSGLEQKTPVLTQNPAAWLGLPDSDSDGELFKPKRSPSRSASLPQSPAVSAPASPRVLPKKPSKKNSASTKMSPLEQPGAYDSDDWLARAKNRRQQHLAKEDLRVDKLAGSLNNERRHTGPGIHHFSEVFRDTSQESAKTFDMTEQPDPWQQDGQSRLPSAGVQPRAPGMEQTSQSVVTTELRQKQQQQTHVPQQQQTHGPQLQQPQASLFQQLQPTQQQLQMENPLWLQQDTLPRSQQDELTLPNKVQPLTDSGQQSLTPECVPPDSHLVSLPPSLVDAAAQVHRLQLERSHTESMLESTRRRYEEEIVTLETLHKNRLKFMEDASKQREVRWREETEELMKQHLAKMRESEHEKSEMNNAHYSRLEELQQQQAVDLSQLKEQHRMTLAALKQDHQDALERLADVKNQEIKLVANAHDTSKNLTAVVQQIQDNAKELGELHTKMDNWSRQGLDEREISLRSKDEQLRMLQDRLNRQADDNDRERKRLEDLIAQMEAQLREQTRSHEEERWKLKQEQGRLESQRKLLEEERTQWLEHQARERINMERARDNHLEEQSRIMVQISEERRVLTEERSKFYIEQKIIKDKAQKDALMRSQAEAEYEALVKAIAEEKSLENTRRQDLQREESKLSAEKSQLERDRQKFQQDQDKLAAQARQIREQSQQIDLLTEDASRTQQEGLNALEQAAQFKVHLEKRERDVQNQLQGLKQMEDRISQEQLRLAKEKKEVENLKSSALCVNCHAPFNRKSQQTGYSSNVSSIEQQCSTFVPKLSASLPLKHQTLDPLDQITLSIASDRAVRMLKIQAIKDKEFLQEESMYLEALKHAPYTATF